MSEPTIRRHTNSGRRITDQDIENLAVEAQAGYDVEALIARRNKRGRPTIGNAPSSVESVRLDPELRRQLLERAEAEGTTTSELIREALRPSSVVGTTTASTAVTGSGASWRGVSERISSVT
jgi:hypothetical protein